MARTVGNLFDEIVSFDNIYAAYLDARKSRRKKLDIAEFGANLEENLIDIHNHLVWGSWTPGSARRFRVFEPKQRDIQAPPFRDRIVHHALVRVVEPLFERGFIYHSYACRKGKGSQRAVWALQKMLRDAQREWGSAYVVKCDISKYFASINHAVLFSEINNTISCRKTLELWLRITRAYGYSDGVGVPVGALTSQLDGNIYMSPIDHIITSGAGLGRYVRYMDDFVIIVKHKAAARAVLAFVDEEVTKLALRLNPKSEYFPASRGVDFAGYRTWSTHILPRKRNLKKANKRFKLLAKKYARGEIGLDYIKPRVASFLGYTKHCRAKRSLEGILRDFTLQRGKDGYQNRKSRATN